MRFVRKEVRSMMSLLLDSRNQGTAADEPSADVISPPPASPCGKWKEAHHE